MNWNTGHRNYFPVGLVSVTVNEKTSRIKSDYIYIPNWSVITYVFWNLSRNLSNDFNAYSFNSFIICSFCKFLARSAFLRIFSSCFSSILTMFSFKCPVFLWGYQKKLHGRKGKRLEEVLFFLLIKLFGTAIRYFSKSDLSSLIRLSFRSIIW